MASGQFNALALPLAFGPWTNAIDGLGYAAAVRIDANPVGDTTLFGEVRYYDKSGQQAVQPFQGTAIINTCDCLQNIEVRFRGVPLGSAVDGTWQTSSTRDATLTHSSGPKGLSLHLGLNHIDPEHYDGWDGELRACENDAHDMRSIAQACGYRTKLLLSEDATSARVLKELSAAAQRLVPGDIFLLTYAGHGSQVPDVNGDEDDGLDETWLLFDRMLVDDELYATWGRFKPGVRIVMVSDSCHSGSMARAPIYQAIATTPLLRRSYGVTEQPVFRVAPDDTAKATYESHKDLYDAVQWSCVEGDRAPVAASVLLMSGCQDNETSADGQSNGLFTGKLKQIWNDGNFKGSYYDFLRHIRLLMPKTQTPNYFTIGRNDKRFEDSQPFSINITAASPKKPRDWEMPELGKDMLPRPTTPQKSEDPWDIPEIEKNMPGKNTTRGGEQDASEVGEFKAALHRVIDEVVTKHRNR